MNPSTTWFEEKIKKINLPDRRIKYIRQGVKQFSPDEIVSLMKKFKSEGNYNYLVALVDGVKETPSLLLVDKLKGEVLSALKESFLKIPSHSGEREGILEKFIDFGGDVGKFCYEVISNRVIFTESEETIIELYFSETPNVNKLINLFSKDSNDKEDPLQEIKSFFDSLAKKCQIYGLNRLIGSYLRQCYYEHIIRGRNIDKNIFIYGESGTGKTTLANIIHEISGRTGKFIKVEQNLSKEEILERISQAKDGTLFIDEVDRIDKEIQKDILTSLPEKGIISASSRAHPSGLTSKEGIESYFVLDFHRRICGSGSYSFEILPLGHKVRREDCKEAINYFWRELTHCVDIDEEVINSLSEKYDWPENLDQIKKVMENIYSAKKVKSDWGKLDKGNLKALLLQLPPDTKEIINQIFSFESKPTPS